jgi:Zn-finger nucleic acid-binding protein
MHDELSGRTLRGEPLRCPVDGSRLVQVDRSEILIDACPECRGVWLDRGELDRILVKERQMAGGDADEDFFREVERRGRPSERPRDRQEEDYPPRRRKRGFLEDLLDFD